MSARLDPEVKRLHAAQSRKRYQQAHRTRWTGAHARQPRKQYRVLWNQEGYWDYAGTGTFSQRVASGELLTAARIEHWNGAAWVPEAPHLPGM